MAGRERVTNWQAENEACSSVREEAWWADWLQACVREEVGLTQVSNLERACYQMVSTVNRIFFALSLFADEGASKWDSAAPEVNFFLEEVT